MQEINFYDLIKFYVKNWLYFVIAICVGIGIGLGYIKYIQTPAYESKATLLVVGAQRTSGTQDSVALNNYLELFKSRRVLGPVIADQKYGGTYESLEKNVTAKNEKSTDIMKVSISSRDPNTSKSLLEGAIGSFRTQVQQLYGEKTLTINTVDQPDLPVEPSNVNPVRQIGIVTVGSVLLLIVGMFFLYDYKQNRAQQTNRPGKKTVAKNSKPRIIKPVKKANSRKNN